MYELDRFLDKITLGDDCWEWQGAKSRDGYGSFRFDGRLGRAHRFAYEWFVAPIPSGWHVDHLCRNPSCVRWDHLDAVTPEENARRTRGHRPRKSHCPSGHPYSAENTGMDKGYPYCRECKRQSCYRQWLKRKARASAGAE